jgi:hypothetical protein
MQEEGVQRVHREIHKRLETNEETDNVLINQDVL